MKTIRPVLMLILLISTCCLSISFAYEQGDDYEPNKYIPLPDDVLKRYAMMNLIRWGVASESELDYNKLMIIPIYNLEGDRILSVVCYYADMEKAPTFEEELLRREPYAKELAELYWDYKQICANGNLTHEQKQPLIDELGKRKSAIEDSVKEPKVFKQECAGSYEQQTGNNTDGWGLSSWITYYQRCFLWLQKEFPSATVGFIRCIYVPGFPYGYEFSVDGVDYLITAATESGVKYSKAEEVEVIQHYTTLTKKTTPDRYPYSPNPWQIYEAGDVFGDIKDITKAKVKEFWDKYGCKDSSSGNNLNGNLNNTDGLPSDSLHDEGDMTQEEFDSEPPPEETDYFIDQVPDYLQAQDLWQIEEEKW